MQTTCNSWQFSAPADDSRECGGIFMMLRTSPKGRVRRATGKLRNSETGKLENWETVENRLQPVAGLRQLHQFHLSADGFPSVTSRQILAIQRRISVSRPNVQSFEQSGRPSTTATRFFAVCQGGCRGRLAEYW